MMEREILIATTNPGKMAELSAMLDLNIAWKSLADFPNLDEVVEDGDTFAENARKKALGYAKQTSLWTVADDSGLVVDALDGAPGVKSARFSGAKDDNRTLIDHKNIAKVLELLKGVPAEKRTARFVCCLCLACPEPVEGASPGKVLIETEGKLEGVITEKEIGTKGFGYDPVVFIPSLNKTVAQLTAEEKNSISHRGNAIRNLKPLLKDVLNGNA
jgi:XTP/dITP diphosphohydrolase